MKIICPYCDGQGVYEKEIDMPILTPVVESPNRKPEINRYIEQISQDIEILEKNISILESKLIIVTRKEDTGIDEELKCKSSTPLGEILYNFSDKIRLCNLKVNLLLSKIEIE